MTHMAGRDRTGRRARDRRSVIADLARQVTRGTYLIDPARIASAIVARMGREPSPMPGEPDDRQR
jgi:hypothetical protein